MKRKIAAIMAADIAGYSKLVAEDEEETLRRLASYRSVFDDFIAKASGRIFNTAGDAVLAEFPSAVEAVRCAIDIQESLRTRNLAFPPSRQMNFRVGMTVGDVVERDGDLLGDGVNIAARLQELAEPGGICVSRSIYEQVTNKLSVRFADIGERQVKNIPTPIHAYVVAASSPQVQSQAKTKSARTIAAVVAGIAALGAASGIYYWIVNPGPASGPKTAMPLPAAASTAPSAVAAPAPSAGLQAGSMPLSGVTVSKPPPTQLAVAANPAPTVHLNETGVRALAEQQNIPLPRTIRILEPSSAVSKKTTEYLGAWGGDRRWGGRGRQMILLVTNIDAVGTATGIYAFGPPTPYTYNQSPAHYWAFTGKISENDLKFESPDGQWKYQFKLMPDGIMQGLADSPKETHPNISIERIN
jgi:class 3 adenylate cyclase